MLILNTDGTDQLREKYFKTVIQLEEDLPDCSSEDEGIKRLNTLIDRIFKAYPRLPKKTAITILNSAITTFNKNHREDVELYCNIYKKQYIRASVKIRELFCETDAGKEDLDLLTLEKMVELMFLRARAELTEKDIEYIFPAMEKFYFKTIDSEYPIVSKNYGKYVSERKEITEDDAKNIGVVLRKIAFAKTTNLIISLEFTKLKSLIFKLE